MLNEFLEDEQWADAVETLRRVMENRGDRLMETPVDAQWQTLGFAAYVPLSEYCQLQLAAWHVRVLRRLWRSTVSRWKASRCAAYEEALAAGSESQLQRVADELMLSSVGDQALLRLGEMALERGNYTLARRHWELLHPHLRVFPAAARVLQCAAGCSWWSALRGRDWPARWTELAAAFAEPGGAVTSLAYPDSDIPLAAVAAPRAGLAARGLARTCGGGAGIAAAARSGGHGSAGRAQRQAGRSPGGPAAECPELAGSAVPRRLDHVGGQRRAQQRGRTQSVDVAMRRPGTSRCRD